MKIYMAHRAYVGDPEAIVSHNVEKIGGHRVSIYFEDGEDSDWQYDWEDNSIRIWEGDHWERGDRDESYTMEEETSYGEYWTFSEEKAQAFMRKCEEEVAMQKEAYFAGF